MKNRLKIALTTIAFTCISSCAKSEVNFSLYIYSETDTFINDLSNKIADEVTQEYGTPLVRYASTSQTIQNEQIVSDLNNKKTNFLLVNIVDRLASSSIIEKASKYNVPVIFFNREPLIEDIVSAGNAYYVGTSPTLEGELQGEYLSKFFKSPTKFKNSKFDKNKNGKLDVVIIKGNLNHQDSELRPEGALKVLNRNGYDINILASKFCNWEKDVAKKSFESIYEDFGNSIEAVISGNDDMALGVIDYLKSLESYENEKEISEQFFPIVGVDATTAGKHSVDNGELTCTVINDSQSQAEAIIELTKYMLYPNKFDWANFPYKFDNEKFIHSEPSLYERKANLDDKTAQK